MNDTALHCPLCASTDGTHYADWHQRSYLICPHCDLVWLHPSHRLPLDAEHAYYRTHQNSPDDAGYRRFLSPAADAVRAAMPPPASGLDYGCGPGPALAAMLDEAGYRMAVYDPRFAPDTGVLDHRYDLVTCTETVEHFHTPAEEFARLGGLLRPGGMLAVMTAFRPGREQFAGWHYVRDPTHTSFYSEATMAWIATRFGWRLTIPARNVATFETPRGEALTPTAGQTA